MIKSLFCENIKCQKSMKKNIKHCSNCFKKFCSNLCINEHLQQFHQINTTKELSKLEKLKETITVEDSQKTDRSQTSHNEPSFTNSDLPELEIVEDPESIFIKEGKYLKEIIDDPHYIFQNFDLRRKLCQKK